jgi:hypothetical protein
MRSFTVAIGNTLDMEKKLEKLEKTGKTGKTAAYAAAYGRR